MKHKYTKAEAPTNTGSLKRPARFNLRLDCETRARTVRMFEQTKEALGYPKDASYADVWEGCLMALEHALWHIRESPTAVKNLVRSLYRPLPREDWVRNRFKELKERLEPAPVPRQMSLAL